MNKTKIDVWEIWEKNFLNAKSFFKSKGAIRHKEIGKSYKRPQGTSQKGRMSNRYEALD